MSLIEQLDLPTDLKKLTKQDLEKVAKEVREKIVDVTSTSGGHLSSSLGTVELSVALHTVFDSPVDKIVWDVGHQAYAHKILTGRLSKFDTLRKTGGLSGFPKREESPHDVFTVGHASTSISQALGLARARDNSDQDYSIIAVIGDGALSGGLALEGINNTLNLKSNLIVILNDNEMSISKPVGAISDYLTRVRTSNVYAGTKDRIESIIGKIPKIGEPLVKSVEDFKNRIKHFFVDFKFGVIFEELGFKYLGPIDGHNIPILMSTLQYAREVNGPVLIHILTKKGKGFGAAEGSPSKFHGVSSFDKNGGAQKKIKGKTYTTSFGEVIGSLAEKDKKITAITAAMTDGTGLASFAEKYPNRFFDVGIAEEHAVSFASGLAAHGDRPVVAVYSTFLQRAYDQIIHDVCLNDLPVVFAVDRAGIVGEDGPTHNGVFDMAFMRLIPNLTVLAPSCDSEMKLMLDFALKHDGPVSIRYPRAEVPSNDVAENMELGRGIIAFDDVEDSSKGKATIISIGSMVRPSVEAAKELANEGIAVRVINARFIKPLDEKLILDSVADASLVVTAEEGCLSGGFGSAVAEVLIKKAVKVPVIRLGVPDSFIQHGKRNEILRMMGLDKEGIIKAIKEKLSR